jgi:hypothetical protein
MFSDERQLPKEAYWDYYDSGKKAYIRLDCKIHQKYATPTLLQIEESEKFHTPVGSASYETPDLQLADYNGRWMTRSDDPYLYPNKPFDGAKDCSICDIVCEIREDVRYLNKDGTCPFPDVAPEPTYWKVAEQKATPCGDYLSPLMLLDLEAVNRKRRRKAYHFLKGYLQQPKWLHAQINSERRMIDVWEKHYQPVTFYFKSFETIILYIKSLKKKRRTPQFLQHLRKNLEFSPSFEQLLQKESEQGLLKKIDQML